MAVDVFQVAEMLVAHTLAHYEDEISIIAYYGSHAMGTATQHSDLDLFYIPVEGSSPDAARSFVIDGITFDFWPVTWQDAGRIANGRFRSFSVAPSLLIHARVLYARTEEDRTRLETLRGKISELQEPANQVAMVRRGLATFPITAYQLENLRLACAEEEATAMRESGWQLSMTTVESLALVNQVIFDQGWIRDLRVLERLDHRPAELQTLIRTVTTSIDSATVLAAAEQLIRETRATLRELQQRMPAKSSEAAVFQGAYAEIWEHVQKLRTACAMNDPVRASHECWHIQTDLSRMLGSSNCAVGYDDFNRCDEYAQPYAEHGFPDLMQAFDPAELDRLADLATEFEAKIVLWFKELGVGLNVFEGIDELAQWLSKPAK